MRNKIFLFSLLIGSMFFQGVNAGVVPGTIQKSSYTPGVSCNSDPNPYYDTYASCKGADPIVSGFHNLYDFSGKTGKSSYKAPYGYVSLDSGVTCDWESQGTNHTPHTTQQIFCSSGYGTGMISNTAYFNGGGYNGSCEAKEGQSNLITSFNQLGIVNRTTSSVSGECSVEGRYAQEDNKAPEISINNVESVFINNDKIWCNIEKYKESGYDKTLHPGCNEYAKKNSNISGNQDLLKGLSINIGSDVSGIFKVEVKLGKCSTVYQTPISDSSILVSPIAPNGVKPIYTNGFSIKYNTSFTAFGVTQDSLLTKFGKSRLDECLGNGKNSLIVTTYDMARANDGVSLLSNKIDKKIQGIFIDNNTSVLDKSGDLTIDNSTNPNMWRNFSLEGNIQIGEEVDKSSLGECTLKSLSGSCSGLNAGYVWVAPLGVNPTTGDYPKYSCDGFEFPTNSECVQQEIPKIPKKCIGTIPGNSIVANTGSLIVDTPWQNTDSTASCFYEIPVNYCIAGGTIPCVVKTTTQVVENGACGTSNNQTFSSKPFGGLCSTGAPSQVFGSGPWSWTCTGINGGTTATCNANKGAVTAGCWEETSIWQDTTEINPAGYPSARYTCQSQAQFLSSLPTCDSDNFYDTCDYDYKYGGSTHVCKPSGTCNNSKVNGICGVANKAILNTQPTSDLCVQGSVGTVLFSPFVDEDTPGEWTWTCSGLSGGEDIDCSATQNMYSWVTLNQTSCSASPQWKWGVCNNGSQSGICENTTGVITQNVECKRIDGLLVDDQFCTGPKPPTSTPCTENCSGNSTQSCALPPPSSSGGGGGQVQIQ